MNPGGRAAGGLRRNWGAHISRYKPSELGRAALSAPSSIASITTTHVQALDVVGGVEGKANYLAMYGRSGTGF
jgi:hypothetical protein